MMPVEGTSEMEKDNLEAHVEFCWQRYQRLQQQINTVDAKVDALAQDIKLMKDEYIQEIRCMRDEHVRDNRALKNAVITGSATILAALIGLITVIVKSHLGA